MTLGLPVCRYCGQPISAPDAAVHLRFEPTNTGPGRDVWAHTEHADLVEPDPVAMRILARVLITRALEP
ncbi:hypothetical protein [Streptomyces sp. V3I7]|uniref:hypothetical protein n=1 Tax=Streptomyces sp. V3I7 TaxID=3042278 RepID=UPI00277FA2B5|nr:hypothetical protein [Streptomyces sp. V3I7]MDQ0993123.1 hypothetical protein [Streptomyces sp. V3I7]